MNPTEDRFGHDPAVIAMRKVFAALEAWEKETIDQIEGLSPLDPRLRSIREAALAGHHKNLAAAGYNLIPEIFIESYKKSYQAELAKAGLAGFNCSRSGSAP